MKDHLECNAGDLHDVARRIAVAGTLEELESIRQVLDGEMIDLGKRVNALEEIFLKGGPRVARGPRRGQLTTIHHRRRLLHELFGAGLRTSGVNDQYLECYRRALRLGAKLAPEAFLAGDPIVCADGAAPAEVA
ncbi:MAG TPA: hypothetical protein VK714_14830 [Myxococcota bacterium]|nr:hypothetical protein [Myxococcota bacterium]